MNDVVNPPAETPATPATPAAPATPATPAAAPAKTAPDGKITPGQDAATDGDAAAAAFTLPDAYKDKGWAKNIKSQDDVLKMLDSAQELAGKKAVIPDLTKATPEEREAYYAQTRPATMEDYAFDDESTTPELKTAFSEMLYKNGISKQQGDDLIKAYNALESQQFEGLYGADGLNKELEASFGKEFQDRAKAAGTMLKEHLSDGDQAMLDKLPNQTLGLIYRLLDGVQGAYGTNEAGAQGGNGTTKIPAQDVTAMRADLRKQIAELGRNPMASAEAKQDLINKLDATYKGR